MKKKQPRWYVYILRASGTLYTGITRDIQKRLSAHASGKGSRYLRGKGPLELVHREVRYGRSNAQKREAAIKALTRPQKMELIGETDKS